jgi:hypothetical protein
LGGWGGEKASSSFGSGMSAEAAKARQCKGGASPGEAAPPGMGYGESGGGVGRKGSQNASERNPSERNRLKQNFSKNIPPKHARRPQLSRVQHDDPFEVSEFGALDDLRPED